MFTCFSNLLLPVAVMLGLLTIDGSDGFQRLPKRRRTSVPRGGAITFECGSTLLIGVERESPVGDAHTESPSRHADGGKYHTRHSTYTL